MGYSLLCLTLGRLLGEEPSWSLHLVMTMLVAVSDACTMLLEPQAQGTAGSSSRLRNWLAARARHSFYLER